MTTPDQTKQDAIATLLATKEIVHLDHITHEGYAVRNSENALRKPAPLCDGINACLLGSLSVGYDRGPHKVPFRQCVQNAENMTSEHRDKRLATRPALRLAYLALNESAHQTLVRINSERYSRFPREANGDYDWTFSGTFHSPAEHLFETVWGFRETGAVKHDDGTAAFIRTRLKRVITRAVRLVEQDKVAL